MEDSRREVVGRIILFVIAWLIGAHVIEAIDGWWGPAVGVPLGVASLFLNVFSRNRANRAIDIAGKRTIKAWGWMYLPVGVYVVLPLCAMVIAHLVMREEGDTWWQMLRNWLPFILELMVPATALVAAYATAGMKHGDGKPKPELARKPEAEPMPENETPSVNDETH